MIVLATLADDRHASPHALYMQLQHVNEKISAHVDREDRILAGLDQSKLDYRWMTSWKSASADLENLRRDWLAFLDKWDVHSIGDQRSEFQTTVNVVLQGLSERVRFETETFYAAALQSNIITLR